jgi:hypothetical protein
MKNLFYLLLLVCINPHLIAQTYDTLALKVGEVYNFEIGDEFHYRHSYETNYSWGSDYSITAILAKSYSVDADTVFYTYQNTNYHVNNCGGLVETDTTQVFITGLDNYIITVGDSTYVDDTLDYHYNRTIIYSADSTKYNGRRVNSALFGDYYFDSGQGGSVTYIEGCGHLTSHWSADNTWYSGNETYLVYFKKGEETWGMPVGMPTNTLPIAPETSMTIGEAYDFDIGDEFQFVRKITNLGNITERYFIKRTVSDKMFNITDSTLFYVYADTVHYEGFGNVSDYAEQDNQTVEHLSTLVFSPGINGCWAASTTLDSCQLLSNTIQFVTDPQYYWEKRNFIKGCGMYRELHNSDGVEENLIHYHKVNGITCGTPIPYFTGLEDAHPQVLQLSILPNPANNQVQIELPATANHQNATLQITDLQGRVVKTVQITPSFGGNSSTPSFGGGKGEASTHDLPNGMYLVSYTVAGKQAITAKLIIVH